MRDVIRGCSLQSTILWLLAVIISIPAWAQTAEKKDQATQPPSSAAQTTEKKDQVPQPPSTVAKPAAAQPVTAPTPPAGVKEPVDPVEEQIKHIKNPAPWISWGFDERLREEYGNNFITVDKDTVGHEKLWSRFRSRLWGIFKPAPDIEIDTRLVWEWRIWCGSNDWGEKYNGTPGQGPGLANPSAVNWDEAIFDHLNFKIKNLFSTPSTLTVGRQDIIFGNGWLVMDGTPLDGSRTIFFDAARLTTQVQEKTKADVIWIEQQAASDQWISPINDQERNVTEQNERGAILYITNNSFEKMQIEGYYIWKHDSIPDVFPGYIPTQYPYFWARESDLHTVGGRFSGNFDENWKYRTEFAHQMGRQADAISFDQAGDSDSVCAFGSNSRLSYLFNDPHNNMLHAGYEFLSSDFDPLWGRWPQWSEMWIYTDATETRIGETNNLHRIQLAWDTDLTKKLHFVAEHNFLWADEKTVGNGLAASYWGPDGGHSENGKFRGQLLATKLLYKHNSHLSSHIWGEYYFPGNFYSDARNDVAVFLRYELMLTF
jgi:hypothetical protein